MNKKKLLIVLLSSIINLSFAVDINTLENDVMNYPKKGYRFQSYGEDYYVNAQGSIKEIDYKYSFCICGKGFFVLRNHENEILFTRNGFFCVNEDGFLVNKDGYFVLGKDSNIQNKDYHYISSDLVLDRTNVNQRGMRRIDTVEVKEVDYFLIMEPKDIIFFQDDYIIAKESTKIKTYIKQYARESFPVSFEQLLDLTLEIFEKNNKEECIEKKKKIFLLLEYQENIIFNEYIFNIKDKQRLEMKLQQIEQYLY